MNDEGFQKDLEALAIEPVTDSSPEKARSSSRKSAQNGAYRQGKRIQDRIIARGGRRLRQPGFPFIIQAQEM